MATPIPVKMKARAWTDGNPADEVERTFMAPVDPDLIRLAGSRDEAIEHFKAAAPYIGEVLQFYWFEISKQRLTWSHEKKGWKLVRV